MRVGFEVTGCDISPTSLEAFDEPGARREADPIAAVRGVDVAGICVLNDAQVEALAGDGRLFESLGKGGIAVIHSTVSPNLPRRASSRWESSTPTATPQMGRSSWKRVANTP